MTTLTRTDVRKRLVQLILELPALVRLIYRLIKDPRVSRMDKVLLAGVVVYVLNPLDLLPDAIPFIGQVDDIYLVAVALIRMAHRTDPSVLRELWDGQEDIVTLVEEVSELAVKFLPKRVQRILLGKLA
ncbi:MAG: YkvA family protein [Acidobacteriota bacterium]